MQLVTIFEAEQEIRKIERALFRTWENIFIYRIKRNPNYPNYTSSIYQQYYQLVASTTRKAIEMIHREGIEYVGNKLKTDVYFSSTDIELIKAESEWATDLFFNAVRKGAEKQQQEDAKTSFELKGAAAEQEQEEREREREREEDQTQLIITIIKAIKTIITSAVTMSFARSILSKANQLPSGLSFTNTGSNTHKIRWITQMDERVCPICRPLNNQVFYTTDVTVPIPGSIGSLGSHPNCRCYFELVN